MAKLICENRFCNLHFFVVKTCTLSHVIKVITIKAMTHGWITLFTLLIAAVNRHRGKSVCRFIFKFVDILSAAGSNDWPDF